MEPFEIGATYRITALGSKRDYIVYYHGRSVYGRHIFEQPEGTISRPKGYGDVISFWSQGTIDGYKWEKVPNGTIK